MHCLRRSCPQGAPALPPDSATGGYGREQLAWGWARPARRLRHMLGSQDAEVPGCPASKRLNDPGPQGAGGLASCAELLEQCESSHSTPECSPRPRRREVGLPGELGRGGGLETVQPGRALPGAPRAACCSAAAKPWLTPRPILAFPPAPLSSGRQPTPHRSRGLWAPNGHRR